MRSATTLRPLGFFPQVVEQAPNRFVCAGEERSILAGSEVFAMLDDVVPGRHLVMTAEEPRRWVYAGLEDIQFRT